MTPIRLALALPFVALGLAVVPWTLRSDGWTGRLTEHLSDAFGLRIGPIGETRLTLLPVPRLSLANVTLSDGAGEALVRNAQLRVELAIAPLLLGRVQATELSLSGARVAIRVDENGGTPWSGTLEHLSRLAAAPGLAGRLVVRDSELDWDDRRLGIRTTLGRLSLVIRWGLQGSSLDAAGSAVWRGETVQVALTGLEPAAQAAGTTDEVRLTASSRLGRLALLGQLSWREAPRFSGQIAAETTSLGPLTRWADVATHLGEIRQPATLVGTGALTPDVLELPKVAISLGDDTLEGSLAARPFTDRPEIRATLAGERIDLSWLRRLIEGAGERPGPSGSEPLTSADYDLRLSAGAVKVDNVRLKEAAAGILISRERMELSLARATLADGLIKARLSSGLAEDGRREVKGQVSVDKVDVGTLLSETGQARLATGTVGGQAAFESIGDGPAEIMRHMRGRMSLVARDGEFAGVALADAWRRGDGRAPSSDWRGGRTAFGQAQVNLTVADGVAEIQDAAIAAGGTHTVVEGRLSLPDRFVSLKATTRGTGPSEGERRPALVLDVNGPLDRLITLSGPSPTGSTGSLR